MDLEKQFLAGKCKIYNFFSYSFCHKSQHRKITSPPTSGQRFNNTESMAATNNNNADAVARISYIYQTVMAKLQAASSVYAATGFTEFFNPVINQEIPYWTNSRGEQQSAISIVINFVAF